MMMLRAVARALLLAAVAMASPLLENGLVPSLENGLVLLQRGAKVMKVRAATRPTVSIIMPTNSRPEFVLHAVDAIARQDYGFIKEVIIVDDSPEEFRLPELTGKSGKFGNFKLTYLTIDSPTSIGAKRNLAVRHASGDIIVHWDDDDFYGPTRISAQVDMIVRGDADLNVLHHTHTYFMEKDELRVADMKWKSVSSWGPHFGTLAYLRSLVWVEGIRFADTSEAEDYGFAQDAVEHGARLRVVPPLPLNASMPLFVCVRHGSNTWEWGKDGDFVPNFQHNSFSVPTAAGVGAGDRQFADSLRASHVPSLMAARRARAPAVNRFKDARVKTSFFDELYIDRAQGPAFDTSCSMTETWPAGSLGTTAITYNSAIFTGGVCSSTVTTQSVSTDMTQDISSTGQAMSCIGETPVGNVYGGTYTHNGDLVMSEDLNLFYFTKFVVTGSLDMGGFSIGLAYNSVLEVSGDLSNVNAITRAVGCCKVTTGPNMVTYYEAAITRITVSGDMSVSNLNVLPPYSEISIGGDLAVTNDLYLQVFSKLYASNVQVGGTFKAKEFVKITAVGQISVASDVVFTHCTGVTAASITASGALTTGPNNKFTATSSFDVAEELVVLEHSEVNGGAVAFGGNVNLYPHTHMSVSSANVAGNLRMQPFTECKATAGVTFQSDLTLDPFSEMYTSSTLDVGGAAELRPLSTLTSEDACNFQGSSLSVGQKVILTCSSVDASPATVTLFEECKVTTGSALVADTINFWAKAEYQTSTLSAAGTCFTADNYVVRPGVYFQGEYMGTADMSQLSGVPDCQASICSTCASLSPANAANCTVARGTGVDTPANAEWLARDFDAACGFPSPSPTPSPTPPTLSPTPSPTTPSPTPSPTTPSPTPSPTPCSGATCTILEDPHVNVFDGVQISLLASNGAASNAAERVVDAIGDMWVVRNMNVSIQARYLPDDDLDTAHLFVRSVAVGGPFLLNNTLLIGSLGDKITWNGLEILGEKESSFEAFGLMKAQRGFGSHRVENMQAASYGVDVELPSGIKLTVNRQPRHVNIAVTMSSPLAGQDGLCGNFNGAAADDTIAMLRRRGLHVSREDSLFPALPAQ